MSHRILLTIGGLAALIAVPVAGQAPKAAPKASPKAASATTKPASAKSTYVAPRTIDGQPDLQGIWNIGTVTPFTRSASLAGKEFYTPAEALAFEKARVEGSNRDQRAPGTQADVERAYNDAWWDSGTKVVRTLRTSMVTEPDGQIPPLTDQAKAAGAARRQLLHNPAWGPEDRGLAERCLMFPTDIVPMTPYVYNNNYRFTQSKDAVALSVEMVHDTRIIPLDGRPHAPSSIRTWFGDARGHFEGNTLVVDTTNFSDKTSFRGSDENLHVIERFTRTDAETILYQFTVDDPTAFTKPWKAEMTMVADPGPMYEYACHEGNYGMRNLLRGARAEEAAAAKK